MRLAKQFYIFSSDFIQSTRFDFLFSFINFIIHYVAIRERERERENVVANERRYVFDCVNTVFRYF